MYVEALDVDEVIAHLLVTEGFSSIEQVAFVPIEDLISIEGFEEDVANELRERAQNFLSQRDIALADQIEKLGIQEDITLVEGVTTELLVLLGEKGIKTRDDLADLSGDELLEMIGNNIDGLEKANQIIMAARSHWFSDSENDNIVSGPVSETEN